MQVHPYILAFHNIMRWVVIILAIVVLVRSYSGWLRKRDYTKQDRMLGMAFGSAADIQLLLGVILVIIDGLSNLGRMAMDHVIPMVVAIIVIHIGSVVARRAKTPALQHRQAALWYSVAVIVMLVSIPWSSRPLLPSL